jgi:hypothetical protein
MQEDLLKVNHGFEGMSNTGLRILMENLLQHPIEFWMFLLHHSGVLKKIF